MRVGLFVTCLVDLVRPRIGFSAIKLLRSAGCEVVVPTSQTCCGQPAWNSGDRNTTAALASKVAEEFIDCDYVVVPSGSCAAMIRTHYPNVQSEPLPQSTLSHVADRTYELTDFLSRFWKNPTFSSTATKTITYHDSCSGLRDLGVKGQPRDLLGKIPNTEIREMPDCESCCGFGGTFSIKYGDISSEMAERKCDSIKNSGADIVVMGDLGCMLNIEGRLRKHHDTDTKVMHIAEVLSGDSD